MCRKGLGPPSYRPWSFLPSLFPEWRPRFHLPHFEKARCFSGFTCQSSNSSTSPHGTNELGLWLNSSERFCQSPEVKTPSPANSVPPAVGITETIVQRLEEESQIFHDIPMDHSTNFVAKSPKRHSIQAGPLANNSSSRSAKKTLNVDSPAFTPATLSVPGKASTISSQAVNAAPFTPRGLASGNQVPRFALWERLTREGTVTPIPQVETEPAPFNPAQIKEFTPQQSYDISTNVCAIHLSKPRSR
jgi:hypothetical protein